MDGIDDERAEESIYDLKSLEDESVVKYSEYLERLARVKDLVSLTRIIMNNKNYIIRSNSIYF